MNPSDALAAAFVGAASALEATRVLVHLLISRLP
jgi:hypothetical protein